MSSEKSKKVESIIAEIKSLNIAEMMELFDGLKTTFGITDNILNVSGGSSKSKVNEEEVVKVDPNKKVNIILNSIGTETKISLIKAFKECFALGLNDSNTKLAEVEKNGTVILKSDLPMQEAEGILSKLKTLIPSANVSIK